MRLLLPALAALLLVVGCGQDPALEAPVDDTAADQPDERAGDVLEGTLGGDAQLEGGCAWLDTGGERYEVVYPDGYAVEFGPLRLRGPDGTTIAEEGDRVRVRGHVADERVSVCQVGTLYEASAVVTDS